MPIVVNDPVVSVLSLGVLLDAERVARGLPRQFVESVRARGWSGQRNGNLLRLAEAEFDVIITLDRQMLSQQGSRASILVSSLSVLVASDGPGTLSSWN
jgi:hypothetical protein